MKDTSWTLNTLRKHLISIIAGNDKRYEQEFNNQKKAVENALAAQKELTASAFNSSEKAIVKAEDAQREYNIRSNEFRGQLDDQAQTLMPRTETNVLIKSIEDKLYTAAKTNADKIEELSKKLDRISIRLTTIEGKGSGAYSLWGLILGAVAVLGIIVTILKAGK